jgi:KipI family sensor histidine kinase inhibitor
VCASPVPCEASWTGDRALRLSFGEGISDDVFARVRRAWSRIRASAIEGLVDATPAYATLLLTFDATALDPAEAERTVLAALSRETAEESAPPREVTLPVRYGDSFGPDLASVASACGLPPDEVVRLHAGATYEVRFLGFSPGFPYLAGLPERLETPRLDRPRLRVPAGSVAIAGKQAGIYPQETPGGWRLLGRTPQRLFDPQRAAAGAAPALLAMGDRVRFRPVSEAEFRALAAEAVA